MPPVTPPSSRKRSRTLQGGRKGSNKNKKSWTPSPESIGALVGMATGSPLAGAVAAASVNTRHTQTRSNNMIRRSGSSTLAGKLKSKKRAPKTLGLADKGIHYSNELRFVQPVSAGAKIESAMIAHTTMPVKTVMNCLWRAIIKRLFLALSVQVRDFTWSLVNTIGCHVNDDIRVNYYAGAGATTISTVNILINAGQTLEGLALEFAKRIGDLSDPPAQGIGAFRWDSIEYVPATSSKFARVNLNLSSMKIGYKVKSHLKIQNRTVAVPSDTSTEEIDNVPLQGRSYIVTGNNIRHKVNRKLLPTLVDPSGIVLGDTFTRGVSTLNTGVNDLPYVTTSIFDQVSEPPQPRDILRLKKWGKVRMNPGVIQTSTLTESGKKCFGWFIKMCQYEQGLVPTQQYNEFFGKCKAIALEKVIGSVSTDVLVAVECQYEMDIACFASQSNYTAPIVEQSST